MIYDVKGINFTYPGSDRQILKDVSLTLNEGDVLAVLGPNGAGKTTMLNCLAGLLKPNSGDILLEGKSMKSLKPHEVAKVIGYVPQIHTPAFSYKVLDFVIMGRAPKVSLLGRPSQDDVDYCYSILEDMGIDHLAGKSYIEISGGERQQVLIARAIAQEPKAILFDEPTAHLDFGNQHKVLYMIKKMSEKGFAVIITTHNPDHALLLGDRTAIVSRDGHLISGKTEDIVTEENLRDIYRTDIKMIRIPEMERVAVVTPKL